MKISEMDKATVFQEIKATHQLQTFDSNSKLWQRAFQLYREAYGQELDMGCGKCWEKVSKFIQS